MIKILETLQDLRGFVGAQRAAHKKISLVPTMGALHEGHMGLMQCGLQQADICIASIFVNPKQFAPHEDYNMYPRTWDVDLQKLQQVGVQAVWHPPLDVMYPAGFETAVKVAEISKPLEGEFRPHFFEGVATVVTKLLLQVLPDVAFFGEKDYQQLLVIKTLQRDLNLPIEIVGAPIVRDVEGLALSSRNIYLLPDELKTAQKINKVLFAMRNKMQAGISITDIEVWGQAELHAAGFDKIDYCTLRDAQTLLPPTQASTSLRILFAGWLGNTRLIDNIAV